MSLEWNTPKVIQAEEINNNKRHPQKCIYQVEKKSHGQKDEILRKIYRLKWLRT